MNIVLIGMPGSGKTTIGNEIAQIVDCVIATGRDAIIHNNRTPLDAAQNVIANFKTFCRD